MPPAETNDLFFFVDDGSFVATDDGLSTQNPLGYPGYEDSLDSARTATSSDESVAAGRATVQGREVEVASFDFSFLGGSMGETTGERIARAIERAAERGIPFVLRTSTGGARMQEGMRSLIQMPKLVAARKELARAHQPLVVIAGHPTTGGVFASIIALADIIVAESEATIGFAGPRVAERFMGRPLSGSSHGASSAFTSGLVDEVVAPGDVKAFIAQVLECIAPATTAESAGEPVVEHASVDPWDAVTAVRDANRPHAPDLLRGASESYVELRGDRQGTDDPAVAAALCRVRGRPIVGIALDRDHAPGPGAYRKAIRALQIAERLGLPVVTLIDTRGADPSEESEAGGIAFGIAALFDAMLSVDSPVLSVVTGEGGSGGALAFAAADRLVGFADSIFSVIGPEGAAEILWRDGTRAPEAARLLRITAADLVDLGIADSIVHGPLTAEAVADTVAHHLPLIEGATAEARRGRWRSM